MTRVLPFPSAVRMRASSRRGGRDADHVGLLASLCRLCDSTAGKRQASAAARIITKDMAGWPSITAALFPVASALVFAAASPLRPPLGLDAFMPVPAGNPLTPTKVELGRRLFLDPILSADRSISCSSCHDPERSFTDDRPKAVGVFDRVGPRRVPKLLNRGYGRSFFWDGRIPTLEEQVLQPVINSLEMDLEISEAVARLAADTGYSLEFRKVFGREPDQDGLAWALASYVRTILSGDSRYDRFLAGATEALDETERMGLDVFRGKGNCGTCHLGPNLTDERFHNTGVGYEDGRFADDGRFAVSGRESERGAFKTPTLRNVAQTAPYMHDGSLATLEDVIDDYDKGGTPNPYLDREIRKLELTDAEKAALAAFMETLTGTVREGLRP